jgi:dCMP deaminase
MSIVNDIINLVSKHEERIDWDDYFISIAFLISSRSSCHRLHVGCVIVKNTRIISVGYNGFLPGAPHNSRVIDGHEQSTVHSEQNCISDCAKRGISVEGATAYITHYPCVNCTKILAASGIKCIKYYYDYKNNDISRDLMSEAGIKLLKLSKKVFEQKNEKKLEKKELKSNDKNPNLELNGISNWKNDFYPYSDINWDATGESWNL